MFWLCPKNRNPKWKVNDFFLWTMAVSETFLAFFFKHTHYFLRNRKSESNQLVLCSIVWKLWPSTRNCKYWPDEEESEQRENGSRRPGQGNKKVRTDEETKGKLSFLRHCCGIKTFGYFSSPLVGRKTHLSALESIFLVSWQQLLLIRPVKREIDIFAKCLGEHLSPSRSSALYVW